MAPAIFLESPACQRQLNNYLPYTHSFRPSHKQVPRQPYYSWACEKSIALNLLFFFALPRDTFASSHVMAVLSDSMIETIKSNAISDELKPVIATFKSTYPNVDAPDSYEDLLTHHSKRNPQ